ncbi:hypothetical protein BT93_E1549 [Corymbia citriodora subsp. variegata]|nr:hypothetical protein BT93_E1549 [Corymbia citriodora subsp. variegata]
MNLSSLSRIFSPGPSEEKQATLTPEELQSMSNYFDETLLSRLQGLSPASVSLGWLSPAVDVAAFAYSAALPLLPDLDLDKADSLSPWYFVDSMRTLAVCNCISSEVAQLRHRHVKLRIAIERLHLDHSPSVEDFHRARNLLADSEGEGSNEVVKSTDTIEELIRDLAPSIRKLGPHGRASPVERAVLHVFRAAVFVMVFVGGVIAAAFHASPGAVGGIEVPKEFPWGRAFRTIESAVIAELGRDQENERRRSALRELEDLKASLRDLIEMMDEVAASGGNQEVVERTRALATKLETANGVLLEGLERLAQSVDGLFATVTDVRTKMMEDLRARPMPEVPLNRFFRD